MRKRNIRVLLCSFVAFLCTIVFGLNVSATADPTNLEGSGMKIEYVSSATSSTKVISGLVDGTGASKRGVWIKLTNMSTQKMTIKGYSQSLASGLDLESLSDMSGIELESGESVTRQLKYSVSSPSTNNKIYNATMVFSYSLSNTYDGDSSSSQAFQKRTFFKVYYRGGNVMPEAYVENTAVGSCDVKLGATPAIISSANLERVSIDSSVSGGGSKTVGYTMNLYVNKSSYTTFQGLGLKFNLENKNDASGEYTRIEDGKSITYEWSGNMTGPAPTTTFTTDLSGSGMASGSTGVLSLNGNLPTNDVASSSPATLTITVPLQSYKPSTLWVKLKGTLTITINIYTTSSSTSTTSPGERTVLKNLIQQYEETGFIPEYSSTSAMTTYNNALSTSKNHLAKANVTSHTLTNDATDLADAYTAVTNSTNKFSEKNVIKQTNNYYDGDQSVGITESNIQYRVYNKFASYSLPYYQDYVDITNRKTNTYTGAITSNLNRTYSYWTVDPSGLQAKIAEAEALNEDEYEENSWQNLLDKVTAAKNYLTNHPDGSNLPARNSTYDTYINNIETAIDNLLPKELTIKFYNYDGTELDSGTYQYGQMPVYEGPTPTRERDNFYNYTFNGWNPEIEVATVDADYTATYTATDRMYTSTYYNDDGTELASFEYKYNEEPAYTEIPTKESTPEYTYEFKGWALDIDGDGNKAYTAEYNATSVIYRITFVDGGDIVDPINVAYDGVIILPNAKKTGYDFGGWYLDEAFSEKANTEFRMPAEDVILYGKWTKTPSPTPDPGGEVVPVPNTNDDATQGEPDDSDNSGSGRLILENSRARNYGRAFISIKNDELSEIVPITDEDKDMLAEGKNIYIYLDVKNIDDSISEKDKVLINKALEEGENIGVYLDISLFKKIADKEEKISKLNKNVRVSFELPNGLINRDKSVDRVYRIVRIHDGISEVIDSEYSDGTLSFETDEFSVYAVIYSDVLKSENVAETGKNGWSYLVLIIAGVIVAVTIALIVRNNRKNIN